MEGGGSLKKDKQLGISATRILYLLSFSFLVVNETNRNYVRNRDTLFLE